MLERKVTLAFVILTRQKARGEGECVNCQKDR